MSSAVEASVLQKAIAEFHAEKPHSRIRREILNRTVKTLQDVSQEEDGYWTHKRVRTWFWNHRDEVPQYAGKRKLEDNDKPEPPKKRKLPKRKATKKKKKPQEPDVKMSLDDGYDTEPDSEIESLQANGNNVSRINFATQSVTSALEMLKPNSESSIAFITSSVRLYRIFACHAVGPDKSPSERWMVKTIGYLCFLSDRTRGRIRWKHDKEFISFCGSLTLQRAGRAFSPEQSYQYSMYGKAGTEVMKERNCWGKDQFASFFRTISSPEAGILNNEDNIRREQDVIAFGRDEVNSAQARTSLALVGGDLVGELEFGYVSGKLCGMKIYSRLIDCDKWFMKLSQTEHALILHTLQDSLLAQQKPQNKPPNPSPVTIPTVNKII